MQKYFIYQLVDPATLKPFYVGCTCCALTKRLQGHIDATRARRKLAVCDYIRTLNQRPVISLLQEVVAEKRAGVSHIEFSWIERLLNEGFSLVNKHGTKNMTAQ